MSEAITDSEYVQFLVSLAWGSPGNNTPTGLWVDSLTLS